jgi:hypothetical protein
MNLLEESKYNTDKKQIDELNEKNIILLEEISYLKSKLHYNEKECKDKIQKITQYWDKLAKKLKASFDTLVKYLSCESEARKVIISQMNKLINEMNKPFFNKNMKNKNDSNLFILSTFETLEECCFIEDINYISLIQKLELENKTLKEKMLISKVTSTLTLGKRRYKMFSSRFTSRKLFYM